MVVVGGLAEEGAVVFSSLMDPYFESLCHAENYS